MFRLVLGYADGQVICTINSIFCSTDKRDLYLALGNASTGIGAIVGPVIGALVYATLGFQVSLFIFSCFIVLMIVLSALLLPNSLNENAETSQDWHLNEEPSEDLQPLMESAPDQVRQERRFTKADFSFSKILSHPRTAFCYFCRFMSQFTISYPMPFLSVHMNERFGVPDEFIGYVYMIVSLCFVLSAISYPLCLRPIPRRILLVISFVMLSICFAVGSHSKYLGFSDSMWTIIFAMVFLGCAQGPLNVVVLPEASETLRLDLGYEINKEPKLDAYIND